MRASIGVGAETVSETWTTRIACLFWCEMHVVKSVVISNVAAEGISALILCPRRLQHMFVVD